ncbi:MAG: hypothetical protein AAF431_11310 [Pseudomonadota bacterium]
MSLLFRWFGLTLVSLVLVTPVYSSEFELANSLALGDNFKSAKAKLKGSCTNTRVVSPQSVRYPLAADKEQHLVCEEYRHAGQYFEQAVFVFADDSLVQIEATSVDVAALIEVLGETDRGYLGMDIYGDGELWLDRDQARLVLLNKQARHPNLFAWHNPFLQDKNYQYPAASVEVPALLDFESNLEQLRPLFQEQCGQIREENHERIWLPNKPQVQVQINCFAYRYAGFERKFEAVFGDGKLHVVWILSGKAEEQRLRDLLQARWGKPSVSNDKWEVYDNGKISLRKDKPELLLLSDEVIPLYQKEFDAQ